MENAVIYARYSSHAQGEQSIEAQLSEGHKYAQRHGYTVIHEYIDRAISGRTDNRAEFQKMLKDTAKHHFSVIILWKVDRFGRNREEIAVNKQRCKKHGVRTEYVAETIPSTPEGVILESVLEGFAEYYSLQLSQNVKRGRRNAAEKCQVIGPLPLGYRKGDDNRFAIDPEEAPLVKRIFRMFQDGQSTYQIADALTNEGYRTKRGNLYKAHAISQILGNERYTGTYILQNIRVEGGVPELIDKDTFKSVQEKLAQNQAAPARVRTKTEYLLSGKLYCGHCGTPMKGISAYNKNNVRYEYYACGHTQNKDHSCKKKPVSKSVIETLILNDLLDILKNPETIQKIIDKVWAFYEQDNTTAEKKAQVERMLKETQTGIDNILKAVESGIISPSFMQRIQELESKKADLEATLKDLAVEQSVRLTRDHIEFFFHKLTQMDFTSNKAKRKLIDTFVNAIYLFDDHLTIGYNYTDNGGNIVTLSLIKELESVDECSSTGRFAPPNPSKTNIFIFVRTVKLPD